MSVGDLFGSDTTSDGYAIAWAERAIMMDNLANEPVFREYLQGRAVELMCRCRCHTILGGNSVADRPSCIHCRTYA